MLVKHFLIFIPRKPALTMWGFLAELLLVRSTEYSHILFTPPWSYHSYLAWTFIRKERESSNSRRRMRLLRLKVSLFFSPHLQHKNKSSAVAGIGGKIQIDCLRKTKGNSTFHISQIKHYPENNVRRRAGAVISKLEEVVRAELKVQLLNKPGNRGAQLRPSNPLPPSLVGTNETEQRIVV